MFAWPPFLFFQHYQQYDTLLPITPCTHNLKAGIAYCTWHVLKGETSKRNDRNETAETTETTETKRPKRNDRNDRNDTTETKRPKRNGRNETAETKRPKRNGRKYKLQEKWKILKYEIYGKFY